MIPSSFQHADNLPPPEMRRIQDIVKEMQEAGVKLLVGTDGRLCSSDIHDEMAEMVAAGRTAVKLLQAATP